MVGKTQRKTALLCCNTYGLEKSPPLVIGRSNKPHCFKSLKKLPCDCTSNKCRTFSWIYLINSTWKWKKKEGILSHSWTSHQCFAQPQDLPNFNNTKVVFYPANWKNSVQLLDLNVVLFVVVWKCTTEKLLSNFLRVKTCNERRVEACYRPWCSAHHGNTSLTCVLKAALRKYDFCFQQKMNVRRHKMKVKIV